MQKNAKLAKQLISINFAVALFALLSKRKKETLKQVHGTAYWRNDPINRSCDRWSGVLNICAISLFCS